MANALASESHEIIFVVREKDVLLDLLKDCNFKTILLGRKKSNSKLGLILSIILRQIKLCLICLKSKPNFLIGTDIVITHIGYFLRIPSFILNEDDAKEVPYLANFGFKYATAVFSPNCCDISPYNTNKIGYNSYHEIAYLHPNYFSPNKKEIEKYIDIDKPFFILRFSDLSAHHDVGKNGINDSLALEIVSMLVEFGNVYITSERKLSKELDPFRISLPPKLIHHALAFSQAFIGDSQTMTAEASVLGTLSVRISDFKGKLSYLNEIEQFGLSTSFLPNNKAGIITHLKKIYNCSKYSTDLKRNELLNEKIDLTAFWVWFFTDYPRSIDSCRNDINYANKFKIST